MNEFLDKLGFTQSLKYELILDFIWAALTLTIGLALAWLISRGIAQMLRRRLKAQEAMLVKRLSYYLLFSLVIIATLHQLGIDLGVLLGAAGILSVAIGFASQTSASNIISGIFLIAERPFVIGDLLNVEGTIGEVVSIDLISVKIRTFDNLMLRVPNEMLIRSTFVNLTRFPIRRLDVQVGVAYKENTEKVRSILFDVAQKNPLCLDEPKPLFIYKGYGDSALELQFSVWAKRENFLLVRNSIQEEIKTAFDKNGIEIPFPHRTLYTGSVTEPFPVRVVEGDA
jgi:small-conductance mechanosensitive channel